MMADDAAAAPAEEVADEARSSAEGTRKAAAWLATALGGIPTIGVLTAVVRAPGDLGFDESQLALGIALAAAGGLIGVLAFAYVRVPLALEDSDLHGLNLTRIPGHEYETWEGDDGLKKALEQLRAAAAEEEHDLTRAAGHSAEAKALAANAEKDAITAEAEAKAKPDDKGLKQEADQKRAEASGKKQEAAAAAARAEEAAATAKTWSDQFAARERIRADAYRLTAADKVRERFGRAIFASVVAVGLIAWGVINLGKAPIPKQDAATAAAATPVLITLTLNPDGQATLGCEAVDSVQALKVGGTEESPSVITLPQSDCPSKTLTFPTSDPKPLGTAEEVEALELPVEESG